jgi:hypothetical protein
MKTVFRKKNEGLKLNSELDFATTEDIIDEFHYLVDTTESLEILLKHTYLIKDTPYLKIVRYAQTRNLMVLYRI